MQGVTHAQRKRRKKRQRENAAHAMVSRRSNADLASVAGLEKRLALVVPLAVELRRALGLGFFMLGADWARGIFDLGLV